MNRPLLPPALAFAAGILVNDSLRWPPGVWLATAAVALLLTFLPTRARTLCLWAGWILAGGLAHAIHATPLSPVDLRRLAGPEARLAELRGVLAETPSLRLKERRGIWTGRTMVRLEVSAWRLPDGLWSPACGAVMTATRGVFPEGLFRGRAVEVTGVLQLPPGPAAPGLFDYQEHLRHSDVAFTLEVARVEDWLLVGERDVRPPWSERFLPWAQQALARGLPDDEATRLLWAMTLGWRTALSGDADTAFMESGTLHVFAISGLHIALIAGLLVALLRAVRVPRRGCGIVVIPLVWSYVAAMGWQSSAVRSALMMTAVVGTWVLNRPGDLLNSLALAALVILIREPGQLLQAGFQLSFGVVAGLALLVPVLEPRLLRMVRIHSDPLLPDALRPRWKQALDFPARWLASALATGGAAFLSSLPFTVHTFHLFSPVSLLANLAVVPLSGLALAANAAALLVTPFWPGLAAVFNASAWLWMKAMVLLSRWFASLPGGVWYVPAPPWPWWWVYGGVLVGVASGFLQTRVRRRTWVLLVAILAPLAAAQIIGRQRSTTLTLLPAGEAIIVNSPGTRRDLVINTGGASSGPAVVTPFLSADGWNRVPVLALGQADALRLGDAIGFLQRFRPREIVVPGDRFRSPAFRAALKAAEGMKLPLRQVRREDDVAGWTVLSPISPDSGRTADDNSLVLRRRFGDLRVLLLSQLSGKSQRALLEGDSGRDDLRADIVISGLPGKQEPLGTDFLTAIAPRLIVITSAHSPSGQRARPELRARLAQTGIPTFFTEEEGALTLEIRSNQAVLRRLDRPLFRLHAEPSLKSGSRGP